MKNTILIILIFATISCMKDKEDSTKFSNEKFVSGDLLIGVSNNAELKTVFDTLNSLDLRISEMNGFFYNANLPSDSVNYLIKFLNQKPYINTGTGWSATTSSVYYYQPESAIRVISSEFNMTAFYQTDFLSTIENLNFVERFGDTKYMLLNVPIGTEKYWLNELKKYQFIKWTELNLIEQINLDKNKTYR